MEETASLRHRGAAADGLKACHLVMADQPVRVDVHDERLAVRVTRGEHVRGGCRAWLGFRYVGDEVLVVVLEDRQDSGLQRATDILRLDDGIGLGIEQLLDVIEHSA